MTKQKAPIVSDRGFLLRTPEDSLIYFRFVVFLAFFFFFTAFFAFIALFFFAIVPSF